MTITNILGKLNPQANHQPTGVDRSQPLFIWGTGGLPKTGVAGIGGCYLYRQSKIADILSKLVLSLYHRHNSVMDEFDICTFYIHILLYSSRHCFGCSGRLPHFCSPDSVIRKMESSI